MSGRRLRTFAVVLAAVTALGGCTSQGTLDAPAPRSEGTPGPAGSLYYATEHDLMKISVGGGTPSTVATGFKKAGGIATTPEGDILVADLPSANSLSHQIIQVSPNGATRTSLSVNLEQSFLTQLRMAVDADGSFYVSEDFRVAKISPDGSQTTTALADLGYPTGIAVDPGGNLFVTNKSAPEIVKLTKGESNPATVPSTQLLEPNALAVSANGDLYVADRIGQQVIKLPADGSPQTTLEDTGNMSWWPIDIAISPSGDVYVASTSDGGSIYRVDLDSGTKEQIATDLGSIRGIASPRT